MNLVFSAIEAQPREELNAEVELPGYTPELLIYWMISELFIHDGLSDEVYIRVIRFLEGFICDENAYSAKARAVVMRQLCWYSEDHYDDIRGSCKFSQRLYDTAVRISNWTDSFVSQQALLLLAHISHRIEKIPTSQVSATTYSRIDFNQADLNNILKHHGPFRFAAIHPEDFEKIIAMIFRRGGYDVQKTSYIGDYGADLVAMKDGDKIAVQVKRYASSSAVGVGDVNQVIGAMQYYQCNKALVITTSRFTEAAREIAKRAKVHLWDWGTLTARIRTLMGDDAI